MNLVEAGGGVSKTFSRTWVIQSCAKIKEHNINKKNSHCVGSSYEETFANE